MSRKLRRLFWIEGRADRGEFVTVIVPAGGILAVYFWALYTWAPHGQNGLWEGIAFFSIVLLLGGAGLAAVGRRLHDLGRSAGWIFAFTLPAKVLNALPRSHPDIVSPTAAGAAIGTALALCLAWLALAPGMPGDNAYGPDPRSRLAPVDPESAPGD